MKVCQHYDRNTLVRPTSSAHTAASFRSDLVKVISELVTRSKVFQYKTGRKHSHFKTIQGSRLGKVDKKYTVKWMQEHYDKLTSDIIESV